jgi:glycyl-tRNA synthetase alpha subunit
VSGIAVDELAQLQVYEEVGDAECRVEAGRAAHARAQRQIGPEQRRQTGYVNTARKPWQGALGRNAASLFNQMSARKSAEYSMRPGAAVAGGHAGAAD